MKIVVTGASGNIGTALLDLWVRDGSEHEVVGVCRRPPRPATPPYDRASWLALDLGEAEGEDQLDDALSGAAAVVHLAWQIQPSRDREQMRRTNVEGTWRVVEAARRTGVRHLVYLSSVAAYRPHPGEAPVDESWPATGVPTSTYSRHKATVEHLLDRVPGSLAVTRLRPPVVGQWLAAGQLQRLAVGPVVPVPIRPLPLPLVLPRGLRLQVVHADDVATAIDRVLELRAAGAYNLCAPDVLRGGDVARSLGAAGTLEVPATLARVGAWLTHQARLHPLEPGWIDLVLGLPVIDAGRARAELGWQPRTSAAQVLAEVASGVRERAGAGAPAMRPRALLHGRRLP